MRTRRYSPTVLAVIALSFSLGAGTFATASHLRVTRSDLAKNAVTSPKVAKNSITGRDVKERSLATVPNADEVRGASVLTFRKRTQPASGNPYSTVVRLAGVHIRSQCSLVQPDVAFPSLSATTTVDHAVILFSATTGVFGSNGDSAFNGDFDFRPGDSVAMAEAESEAVVTFTYSTNSGRVVEGTVGMTWQGSTCVIDGTIRGG